MQTIQSLLKQLIDITDSDRNRKNREFWQNIDKPWLRDMWRGTPQGNLKTTPFTIAPDNSMWSYILDIDLRDYYKSAEEHLKNQIKLKIWHYNNFKDNTYFRKDLYIWFGVVTELSLFSDKISFFPKREGWITENLIKEKKDLLNLKIPDFYNSGLMPRIHDFYEKINNIIKDSFKLEVMFPDWVRGPFCIASHLRGMENFLIDMIEDPNFVHDLMRFVTNSRKHFSRKRAGFLNKPIPKAKLFNDEISTPIINKTLYDEFILPYEIELSKFYGGIEYWHSCGQTTDFYRSIAKIPRLEMVHISPWADLGKAVEVFDENIAFDICLNPHVDVLESNKENMEKKIREIEGICKGRKHAIRADAFQVINNLEENLKKMKTWCKVAANVLSK